MEPRERLLQRLRSDYRKLTAGSLAFFRRAEKVMVRGGSHSLRLWKPYPIYVAGARGARITDVDGRTYVDYWQGHYANILGHNPPEILDDMKARLEEDGCLHTGFEALHQVELAETLFEHLRLPGYRVRFTTSGTLAAMYALMLARAHTGRDLIVKVGGGWHGASPFLLKGVKFSAARGFGGEESGGLDRDMLRRTLVVGFDDAGDLERAFRSRGDRIAAFIVEPYLGVGGFLPASPEYLRAARELTRRHGALLIFDEIISGFRFGPTGALTLYGVRPDLATFGKVIGGGHAVAAVVGRKDVMAGCEKPRGAGARVQFEGGTFSSHSEYLRAGLVMLRHLAANASTVYPRLAEAGERLRSGIEKAFAAEGIQVVCTGGGRGPIPGSSLFMVNFPRGGACCATPAEILDDRRSDQRLREEALKLALLARGVHVVHGGGSVSTAHTDADLDATLAAYADAAALFRKYLG